MIRFLISVSIFILSSVCFGQTPEYLGAYVVQDIIASGGVHQGTVCKPYPDTDGQMQQPDERCGQKVLVYRSPSHDQVAFFEAPTENSPETDDLLTFSVFRGALLARNRLCEMILPVTDLPGLFTSSTCRGFAVADPSSKDADTYMFFPNMEPKPGQMTSLEDVAASRALVTGVITGLPVGVAYLYSISVPKSESSTEPIIIKEHSHAVALIFSGNFLNTLILRPAPQGLLP